MIKKTFCVFVILFIIFVNQLSFNHCFASVGPDGEVENQINENIDEQLANLDTEDLDFLFSEIVDDKAIFGSKHINDRLYDIVHGNISVDANSLIKYMVDVFLDDVVVFLPYICLIIAIAVLYSMVSNGASSNNSIGNVVHFVGYGSIVLIVISAVTYLVRITSACVGSIKVQMDVVFPILLTMLAALGGNVSIGIYQPAMAVLSGVVLMVFASVLLPLFSFKLVFTIISNLTKDVKLNKFSELFGSCFKWLLGGTVTIFTAFVSIQGLMSGSIDGVSMKAAKYTIKNGIPLVGGFLSDGVSLIMLSCSLIKNSVGVSGLLLLFCTIIIPVLKIIVFSFLMKLASSILEPIADVRVTSFVNDISKLIPTLIALILGIAFMYFIITGLIMCSLNIF